MKNVAGHIDRVFREHGVTLTLGAEPTCVPLDPRGAEWSVAATGPTKLGYAHKLADVLVARTLRGGAVIFAPGKLYPGEVNPRWALHVVARRDGQPLLRPRRTNRRASAADAAALLERLATSLGLKAKARELQDPLAANATVWALPLDFEDGKWSVANWKWPRRAPLVRAEGPAGLRLPWDLASGEGPRRALTVELRDGALAVFLPPLLQEPWAALLAAVQDSVPAGCQCVLAGYVPEDTAGEWRSLVIAADPGVLEINLPACRTWPEYDAWLKALEVAQEKTGLRTCRTGRNGAVEGTGGGHHLLFGGPSLDEHPFFTRPAWLVSLLRYWQHHPSLAYFFTGHYVGSSAQAPRADESRAGLWDLEMAYAWLEDLPAGTDHRRAISETLIHLHSDASGNTHRAEVSFDKFWNTSFPGGTRGLVEFRALESLPRVPWASAVALLWMSLAAHLLARPFRSGLVDFAGRLHDRYMLPGPLWTDFSTVLSDLADGGFALDAKVFRAIWEWRFPVLLKTADGLTVRRALEPWPLLCETPLEGGSTSRFVDTSVERLEIAAPKDFARHHRIFVNGRRLNLRAWDRTSALAGLRYRSSALHPCLHPGIPIQTPLVLEIEGDGASTCHVLKAGRAKFNRSRKPAPPHRAPCRGAQKDDFTADLRLD